MSEPARIDLFGVPILSASIDEAIDRIEALCRDAAPAHVAYVNAHSLRLTWSDEEYREILRSADLVLNDGIGLTIAAALQRKRFQSNLNGTDLTPRILEMAAKNDFGVYLLGARPGVAETAAQNLRERIPQLRIVGTQHGHFADTDTASILAAIREAGPQLLIVAMGNPLQEKWLDTHLNATGAHLGMGVGAFLDFASGTVSRAPMLFRKLRIEWLYRLAREPKRMADRYLVGGPLFIIRSIFAALRPSPGSRASSRDEGQSAEQN